MKIILYFINAVIKYTREIVLKKLFRGINVNTKYQRNFLLNKYEAEACRRAYQNYLYEK